MMGVMPSFHSLQSTPATLSTPPAGSATVVGYSGGLDSTVLLHVLAADVRMRERGLRVLHVHHGLHPDADAWATHCQTFCDSLSVALRIVRVEVARDSGHGLEAAARHARHAAFEAELGNDEVLALAHHRDDQAETFLLRALRASGPDGLGAMRPWRRFEHGWLWRPLLSRSRAELLTYALQHGLPWIDDPGNADPSFDRNFLRQRVLPLLHERWPQAGAAFARSATLCADATGLLDDEDARCLASIATVEPSTLSRDRLRCLPASRRARVLRRWIAELGLPPLPADGVSRIERELLDARVDAEPVYAWHGHELRAWRDLLHTRRQRPPLSGGWRQGWDGAAPLSLPDGGELTLHGVARPERPFVVHARRGGERIILPGRTHSHALKHVLQDFGVPPWVRERLPLLSDVDGELLAAGDLVHSGGFDQWQREHGARLAWLDD